MRLFLFTLLLCVTPSWAYAQTPDRASSDGSSTQAAESDERDELDESGEQAVEVDEPGEESAAGDESEQGEEASTGVSSDQPDPFADFDDLDPTSPNRTPTSEGRSLQLLTRSELGDAGFEFGDEAESTDTSTALLLSVTAGVFAHGLGHLYLGDRRTGFFLLGMEALGLGLIASSASFLSVTGGAHPGAAIMGPALQTGIGLFVYSFLLDVVGVLHGGEQELSPNTSLNRGFGFRARYGFFNASAFPVRHAIDAEIAGDFGGFYAAAGTMQDIFLDAAKYDGRLGVRPIRGNAPLTFVSFEANGEILEWQGLGEFGYFSVDGRVGGSYQFGRAFPGIDEVALGAEIGLGNRWYQIARGTETTFELAHTRLFVPFDLNASVNLSQRLNVALGYGTSELSLIPAVHNLLGVGHVEFLYRGTSYGDISLRTEAGDGLAIFLGGSLWFGR